MPGIDTAQPTDVAARKAWLTQRLGELGEQINTGREAQEEAKELLPEALEIGVGGPSKLQRLLSFSLTDTTIYRWTRSGKAG